MEHVAESMVVPPSAEFPATSAPRRSGHARKANGNGHANGTATIEADHLHELLHALQAMRVGDFSVRLPGDQTGLAGKIADTFNEIVAANERMAQQLEQVGQVVGREGKTRQRVKFGLSQRRLGRDGELGQHADRRSAVADHRR